MARGPKWQGLWPDRGSGSPWSCTWWWRFAAFASLTTGFTRHVGFTAGASSTSTTTAYCNHCGISPRHGVLVLIGITRYFVTVRVGTGASSLLRDYVGASCSNAWATWSFCMGNLRNLAPFIYMCDACRHAGVRLRSVLLSLVVVPSASGFTVHILLYRRPMRCTGLLAYAGCVEAVLYHYVPNTKRAHRFLLVLVAPLRWWLLFWFHSASSSSPQAVAVPWALCLLGLQ